MANTVLRRTIVTLLLGAALAGGAVACGAPASHDGASVPSTASRAPHNGQDVMFSRMMIPHHQQAITMSEHELTVGTDPAVKGLARRIKQDQAPEIRTMRGWLAAWHASATHGGMMGRHDHGEEMMELQQFQQARGRQADRLYLRLMIQHHQGAVDMAHHEQRHGQDPKAKQLATSIANSQQAQIMEMRHMLDK